jgi:hypothetical protein
MLHIPKQKCCAISDKGRPYNQIIVSTPHQTHTHALVRSDIRACKGQRTCNAVQCKLTRSRSPRARLPLSLEVRPRFAKPPHSLATSRHRASSPHTTPDRLEVATAPIATAPAANATAGGLGFGLG